MRFFGFSTGALAKGDFHSALGFLREHDTKAIELSALRLHELPRLSEALLSDELQSTLEPYDYRSIHAPSKFGADEEPSVVEALLQCAELGFSIVVHPDAINDFSAWRAFGAALCVENNDKRKPGRTITELAPVFEKLPEAGWCLDLAHGRQVDGTMYEVWRMLQELTPRLRHIHLSELNHVCAHEPLSMGTVRSVQSLAYAIPDVPVIIESVVRPERIGFELEMARCCFQAMVEKHPPTADAAE